MNVAILVNNSASPQARYLTWAPSPCSIKVTDPSGAVLPGVAVQLSSVASTGGGTVVFRSGTTGAFTASLTITTSATGQGTFFAAGKFGSASSKDGDVKIHAKIGATVAGSVPVMVRIRKNANTLSAGERDRIVGAFATLNDNGKGKFTDFRNMHTNVSSPQAHGAPGFLPWHRSYLLDLERTLQAIDPSVTIPYWRFDQPAPNIFKLEFLGVSDAIGTVTFAPGNPLNFWKTDGVVGINRTPHFPTSSAPPGLLNETQTLALGSLYADFRDLEGDPHGLAHTSFGGSISSIPTAARDPLFFMLHCNVDRLWAKWQRKFARFDFTVAAAFDSSPSNPVGHNLTDTMWPWNGITGPPRPPTAPGGPMVSSAAVAAPGPKPKVQDMLDYHGVAHAAARLGFDYDDVPFA
jgi:tyrosinase